MHTSIEGVLPADLAERVAKLLPRLASDQLGEVGATAAAIGRTLEKAGKDWHDFAAYVAEGPREVIVYREVRRTDPKPKPRPAPEPKQAPEPPPKMRQDLIDDVRRFQGQGADILSAWGLSFLRSIEGHLLLQHRLSDKQLGILDRIRGKVGRFS